MKIVHMYTDGICFPNPGKVGYAALLMNEERTVRKLFSGSKPKGTNNTAEIYAAIEGLKRLKEPCVVHLYSDSQYMLNCASGEWQRNSNLDVWAEFDRAANGHEIHPHWIRGHSGQPENEAVHTAAEKEARS